MLSIVEATKMPGSGELVLTGQLGELERGMERERDGNRKAEWSCIVVILMLLLLYRYQIV